VLSYDEEAQSSTIEKGYFAGFKEAA
jgi:hypothetical protein